MKNIVIVLLFFFQLLLSQEQNYSQCNNRIFGLEKKSIVTYSLLAYSTASLYTEYQWWWKGNYHTFRYENDGFLNNYSLGIDKIGHFYTSYFYFTAVYEVMRWAEFDDDMILIGAIAMPLSHAVSIEIGDGFSTYAFSGVDLAANLLGIGYGVLQHSVPFLQNFTFKWSYYPSGIIPLDNAFRLTDDYDGHIYWLAWNVHGTLPDSWKDYWPQYLNLAIGYGGKNVSGRPIWIGNPISSPGPSERKFAISLDYNIRAFDVGQGFFKTIRNVIDRFHFPAPGVKITNTNSTAFEPILLN